MITLALVSAGILGFIWLGYPLLIRLIARARRGAAPADPATWPVVSVIIASRDPAVLLGPRLIDALASEYPGTLEVIAALDAGSPAAEAEIAALAPEARVVRGSLPGGKATALDAGVAAARGSVLVFSDTHQRFAPDAVRQLVRWLAVGRWGVVSGRLELPEDGRASLVERYWRLERRLRHDEALLHSSIGVSGSIYAMRRELWRPLPPGLILDDLYIPMRLVLEGHRIGFADEARAFDSRRTAAGDEYHRKVRTLTGNFQLCAWLPAVLVPGRNPVWLQFVFHKLLRLLTPWLFLALLVGTAGAIIARAGWLGAGVIAAVAFVLAGILVASGRGGSMLRVAGWIWTMQRSVVAATANGLRGRWNVWERPR